MNAKLYDTVLKVGAFFFGTSVFLGLLYGFRDAIALGFFVASFVPVGLFIMYSGVVRREYSDQELPFPLNRSPKGILMDAVNESCWTALFAIAGYVVTSPSRAFEGTQVSIPVLITFLIFMGYILTLFYYAAAAKRERARLRNRESRDKKRLDAVESRLVLLEKRSVALESEKSAPKSEKEGL